MDRYQVDSLLGRGGLAEVYKVRHTQLGGVHALKLLTWHARSMTERLLLEGRIQAQLRHPNVVRVVDVLEHDGRFGLLMEFVDNHSLEEVLDRGAPSLELALDLLASILAGMAAAHDAGVLHRDLKPANILLARVPGGVIPKITDFGIAKVVHDAMEADGSTGAGVTMGTPGYMAPEQIRDAGDVDSRADVFALCAIAYELISGVRAFADEQGRMDITSTLTPPSKGLDAQAPGCPPGVAAVVMEGLAMDREARPTDARALAERLFAERPDLLSRVTETDLAPLSFTGEAPTGRARAPVTALELPSTAPAEHTLALPPAERPVADRRLWWVGVTALTGAAGVGAVLLIGVVAALSWRTAAEPDPAPGPDVPVEAPAAVPSPAPAPPDEPAPAGVDEVEAPPADAPPADAPPAPAQAEAPDVAPADPTPAPPIDVPPAPPVEDEPVAVAAAPPEVAPPVEEAAEVPDRSAWMAGDWSGTANRRPFRLRLQVSDGGLLRGQAIFVQGPSERVVAVRGTHDPDRGTLELVADDGSLTLSGAAGEDGLSGSYSNGKREFAWTVQR